MAETINSSKFQKSSLHECFGLVGEQIVDTEFAIVRLEKVNKKGLQAMKGIDQSSRYWLQHHLEIVLYIQMDGSNEL